MDMHLPDGNGADATVAVLDASPQTKILVLSASAERNDVLDAIIAGDLDGIRALTQMDWNFVYPPAYVDPVSGERDLEADRVRARRRLQQLPYPLHSCADVRAPLPHVAQRPQAFVGNGFVWVQPMSLAEEPEHQL